MQGKRRHLRLWAGNWAAGVPLQCEPEFGDAVLREPRPCPVSTELTSLLSMNDTDILVAGRSRSEDRICGERAKPGFLLNRRLFG